MAGAVPEGWEIETPGAPVEGGAAAPAALPPGFEVAAAPGMEEERAAASSPDELKAGITEMIVGRKPLEEVRNYVRRSGWTLDEPTEKWLDENYQSYLDDPRPRGVNVDVPDPQAQEDPAWYESAWSGVKSGALRGYDDEWQALWGAIGNKIGTATGMNESTADFWDIYAQALDENREYKDRAYNANTLAYGAGFIPGMLTGPSLVRTPAQTTTGRVGQAMGIGAVEGGLSASGNAEGGLEDRLTSAAIGAGGGAALGAVTYPLGVAGSSIISRISNRVGGGNDLNSGLNVLAQRADQDPAAMVARADTMEAAGVPPRLVDVVDESGRGVIRDAGGRMTPARQELVEHADDVYTGAQERVVQQARDNISDSALTARQLSQTIEVEQQAMGPRFDAVRYNPVNVTPEIVQSLNTAEGRNVLRTIARYMTPREQGQLNNFVKALQQQAKQGTPEEQAAKMVPGFERMSPDAQRQVIQQLDLPDPMKDAKFTVDMADKFARLITHRAKDVPALRRVAKDYADTIRGAARRQYPEYDTALVDFENLASVGEAAGGTGRFEGTDFLSAPPDQYAPAVAGANRAGQPVSDPPLYPSEYSAMRDRARDEVVDRADAGSGAGAMSVARQIARGGAQRRRNEALLGEEGARRFESGMREEVRRVDNTRYVDPRIGSQTASRMMDAEDDALNFAADAATSGKWGVVRGVARWLRGENIRNVDAERLVRDAIDPNQTRQAIDYLVSRGLEISRARSVVRGIQASMAGRTAGALTTTEERPAPPNSVRVLLKEPR